MHLSRIRFTPAIVRPIALALLLPSFGLFGDEPTLSFPIAIVASTRVRSYVCDGRKDVSVVYVATADGDVFAYLRAEDRPHIFVRVLADSGDRYVSGPYVWAIGGSTASLTRSDDAGAAPLLGGCVVAPPPSPALRGRIAIGAR